jgi:glucosamine--fructose-6-phosphate aminotransferase (isomerizing)
LPTPAKADPTGEQTPRINLSSRSGAAGGHDLEGAFALAVSADYPDELMVVRQQAPLVIGFGQGEFFCASDTPAIVPYTRAVLPLENGELASLTPLGVQSTPSREIACANIPSP